MKTYLFVLTAVLVMSSFASATNYYVNAVSGNDSWNGLAAAWDGADGPKRTIQEGIDAASDNDTVIVAEGIYTNDPNNRDLDFSHNLGAGQFRSIIVRSTDPNDPNVVANTVIDPNSIGRGFYFHSNEDANCIVDGFTITRGFPFPSANGAAIYCDNSSPLIRNCVIEKSGKKNGDVTEAGGGVYCNSASPSIVNCTISGNEANYGGGLSFNNESDAKVIGCVITGNIATTEGGGIDCYNSNPVFVNCIIAGNSASSGSGGGINCFSSNDVNLVNCSIVANSAVNNGGGVYYQDGTSSRIESSILWANSANNGSQISLFSSSTASVVYSDVQGGETAVDDPCNGLVWDSNNIDSDPCFADFNQVGDANMWDFHLQSMAGRYDANSQNWIIDSNTSSCIDSGDPNSDWTNEPWPNGKRINMGAYGATIEASKNGNIADFNVDDIVDFIDFDQFADKWRSTENCIEDLNQDRLKVDEADLYIFTQNWLWQK